jgi:transcriptional regulator of acetoin/glycerol metabolism
MPITANRPPTSKTTKQPCWKANYSVTRNVPSPGRHKPSLDSSRWPTAEDLFYRLNVVAIDLPPLRDRREDIPALIEHFLTTRQLGKTRCQLHPDAMQALRSYDWPGNIRELANVLEGAQILTEDDLFTADDLPEGMRLPATTQSAPFMSLCCILSCSRSKAW